MTWSGASLSIQHTHTHWWCDGSIRLHSQFHNYRWKVSPLLNSLSLTHSHTHAHTCTHTKTHFHLISSAGGFKVDIILLYVCVLDVCVFFMVACVYFLCIPIIADKCAPALLPRRGPMAPVWWGHSVHLLSVNCPIAPQDTGEHSVVNPHLNILSFAYSVWFDLFYLSFIPHNSSYLTQRCGCVPLLVNLGTVTQFSILLHQKEKTPTLSLAQHYFSLTKASCLHTCDIMQVFKVLFKILYQILKF